MQNKKLYRSSNDKKLVGVAGGIAEYFGIDSSLVRIVFILTLFAGSIGFWVYIILAVFLKYNPDYTPSEYSNGNVKKLFRAKDGKVSGVCQGLANYFDIDVTALRVIMVIAALCGVGILFYIAAILVIPEEK